MKLLRNLALVALSVFAGGLEAGVYKWVDENGRVHYGDRPLSENSEELEVRSAPTVPVPLRRSDRAQRMLEILEEDRQRKKEQAVEQKRVEAQREQHCILARDRLKRYESAGYLFDRDRQGSQRVLTSEQRVEALDKARQAVKHWCGRSRDDIQH